MFAQKFGPFLTLVVVTAAALSAVEAKPHKNAPKDAAVVEESENVSQETLNQIVITQPESVNQHDEFSRDFSRRDYFHVYKKAITLRIGAVFGFEDSSDDEDLTNAILGFSFLLPREKSPQIEVGADLSTVGHGHFTVMKRKIFSERSSFRPFYRYGLMHKLDPDDRFASFSDYENYLGRVGLGFEDSRRMARSTRIEVELAVGTKDFLGFVSIGRVYSF